MLIIPELKTVVLQPPRTGSTSLRDVILQTYPRAISLYRHMERTGIPPGYEIWRTCCLIRDPFERLVSIYNYMSAFAATSKVATREWVERMSGDTDRPFPQWLEESREVFTDPLDVDGTFNPYYNVCDPTPIARKSQARWARPDLGPVSLLPIDDADRLQEVLGVAAPVMNQATRPGRPERCARVEAHIQRHFAWDLAVTRPWMRARRRIA